MTTAASLVCRQIIGPGEEREDPRERERLLDRVAAAMAKIAPVYGFECDSNTSRQLRPSELIDGRFLRGATLFRTRTGKEFRRLTILRDDLWAAVAILKRARVRLRP